MTKEQVLEKLKFDIELRGLSKNTLLMVQGCDSAKLLL